MGRRPPGAADAPVAANSALPTISAAAARVRVSMTRPLPSVEQGVPPIVFTTAKVDRPFRSGRFDASNPVLRLDPTSGSIDRLSEIGCSETLSVADVTFQKLLKYQSCFGSLFRRSGDFGSDHAALRQKVSGGGSPRRGHPQASPPSVHFDARTIVLYDTAQRENDRSQQSGRPSTRR